MWYQNKVKLSIPGYLQRQSTSQIAGWILLASLLVQIGLIGSLDFRDVNSTRSNDQLEYHKYRVWIHSGLNYYEQGIRPPIYPYLTAFLYQFTPDVNLVRVVQVFAHLGLCLVFFVLARRLADERAALVTLALLAFYPGLVYLNMMLFADTTFTVLGGLGFAAGALMLSELEKGGKGWRWVLYAILAGLAISLAYMTRSPGVFSLAALGLVLLWKRPARWFSAGVVVAGVFAISIVPMLLQTHAARGYWGTTENIFWWALLLGNNASSQVVLVWKGVDSVSETLASSVEACRDPQYLYKGYQDCTGELQKAVLAEIQSRPGLAFARIFGKAFDIWTPERSFAGDVQDGDWGPLPGWAWLAAGGIANLGYLVTLVGGLAGFYHTSQNKAGLPLWVWYAGLVLLLTTFGIALVTWGHPRYHKPLIPILALLAGPGLLWLRSWVRSRFSI